METKRLNVNVPVENHRDFHVFAVSQGASMTDLVNQFVADEPRVQALREMVASLPTESRVKDLSIQPDEITPRKPGEWVWEYRLPSGRKAMVIKTDTGIFLSH